MKDEEFEKITLKALRGEKINRGGFVNRGHIENHNKKEYIDNGCYWELTFNDFELKEIIEEYANQRVIEELEKCSSELKKVYSDMCEETMYSYVGGLIQSVQERIKELKTRGVPS